ncbi:hypothetical protein [Nocardia nova]|uniref:hypothetical protein n=1 Tax=Nocardia nova TaxID=37330 RepID=UPI0011B0B8D1|nr:hypothetical protein [Nocardia nova]
MSGAAILLWAVLAAITIAVVALIAEDLRPDPNDVQPPVPPLPAAAPVPAIPVIRIVELPPIALSHNLPERALTPDEAHAITQEHRKCLAIECKRKAYAIAVLIAAERMVPDTRR